MAENLFVRLADFMFELGELRFMPRGHQPKLLTHDPSDNIATHSFYVTVFAWRLALQEGVDVDRTVKMALVHDWPESRTGDQNWVNRRYTEEREQMAAAEQLLGLEDEEEIKSLIEEFNAQATLEALVVRDADHLAEILTLIQYAEAGNQEAERWLAGKGQSESGSYLKYLQTTSGGRLALAMRHRTPTDWWRGLYQSKKNESG